MTLKIKTMLLPTGKFALVFEREDPSRLSKNQVDALSDFRRNVGAVAGLLVTEKVAVEDAMVDPSAVEHTEHVEAEAPPLDLGRWFDWSTVSSRLPLRHADNLPRAIREWEEVVQETAATFKLVQNGAELKDNGLVQLTEEQKDNWPGAELEPELQAALNEEAQLDALQQGYLLDDVSAAVSDEQAGRIRQQVEAFVDDGNDDPDEDLRDALGVTPVTVTQDVCPCYPEGRMTVDAACDNCPLDRGFGNLTVGDRVRVKVDESLYGSTGIKGYEGVATQLRNGPIGYEGPVVWVGPTMDENRYIVRAQDVERI